MTRSRFLLVASAFVLMVAQVSADQAGRRHAENDLHARPAVKITVGIQNADLIGNDNRVLQAAVDYVANLGGGVVEIGPGEYRMRDSLHLRSRVTVRGAGDQTLLKKEREHRSPLVADGDFGEAAITVKDATGFEIGRGVYVASKSQRNFHGVCATLLNTRGNYFTLSRAMNADIMVADGGFAATVYPVISGYHLEDARVENLAVDGYRAENPTQVDGCRAAGIFLYRGDHCVISRCLVRDYNGDGISFQQSNDVQVEHCVVERCAGFGLHPGSGSQRPSVIHCRATGNGDDGFFFCWRVRGGLAEDNVLENNGGHGMSIGHKDSDNFVRRNTIIGNRRGGVLWRAETEPMAAHRITFENNTVRDNEGWGLFVDGATQGTIIRNNTIEDTGIGRQKTGIRLGKNAGAVVLADNTIRAAQPMLDERRNATGADAPNRSWLYAMCVEMGVPGINPRPLSEQAALLREFGFKGLGNELWLDGQLPDNLKILDDARLPLLMCWTLLNVNPTNGPAYGSTLPQAIRQLKGRPVTVCVLLQGLPPSDPQGFGPATKALRELGDVAAEAGVRLSVYHHLNDWSESLPLAIEVVNQVNHSQVGFNFNLCHWLKVDGAKDYRPWLRKHAAKLFCVTLNGATSGAKDWANGLIRPLDEGDFDLHPLLAVLEEIHYPGPIGLMCYGIPGDPRDYLARSLRTWRSLLAAVRSTR